VSAPPAIAVKARSLWRVFFAGWALGGTGELVAQAPPAPREPRAGYVFPAGGRPGTTFTATMGGQFLDGATNVVASGSGLRAVVRDHVKPLTQRQINDLREQLKQMQEAPAADRDPAAIAQIRRQLAEAPRKLANPGLAEIVTLEVTLASDAPPGPRELRLLTAGGLSNPLHFQVGVFPETPESEPNDRTVTAAAPIALPATLNGQILQGDVDRFVLQARRGQRLVAAASARVLTPYLADAVPGWFQAVLTLYDAQGREVAFADDDRFQPDPVLRFEVPEDGEYVLEIRDAIHRGREDFVYRIAVGELPFLSSVFPLGARSGTTPVVALEGWNLPVRTWQPGPGEPAFVELERLADGPPLASNRLPFTWDTLPEALESEPNEVPANAPAVSLPVILNGRIGTPGDCDGFRFSGRGGETVVAEVSARRLHSPLDATLELTDATGRRLAFNDDLEDQGDGLTTHHADSRVSVRLPEDGEYRVLVRDAQGQGSAAHAYRLRLSPPRPDFELRVMPATLNVRAGTSVPFTVRALRRDGFAGEITLGLKDAPAGLVLGGAWIPAGQDTVRLTLTAPPKPAPEPIRLRIGGQARIGGQEIRREAVPADDRMQAFIYRHLVPAQEGFVTVLPSPRPPTLVRYLTRLPLRIPAGGSARLQLASPRRPATGSLHFALSEPLAGLNLRALPPAAGSLELEITHVTNGLPAGTQGNLLLEASADRGAAGGGGKGAAGLRRAPGFTLPAVPFEVVAP
jgi:hypothetical protein